MHTSHQHALELIKQGQWDAAHQVVQNHSDRLSCLIHAYLHRLQNDLDNAQYWYHRVGAEIPEHSLEQEFANLIELTQSRD